MVITNLITFLSYVCICLTLLYLARRTGRVIAPDWAYFVVGFALFIVACGSTHALEVVTTWVPIFWVDAGTNIVTAVLSAYVATMLIRRASTIAFGINDYADRLSRTEEDKRRMQDSLLAARKLEDWSRISAAVNHEIRNPLEAIQNCLYLIRTSDGVSPEVADIARCAAEESVRVLTISGATLSYFRETTNPELIDLRAAVDSVRFLLGSLIHDKAIVFEVEDSGDCTVEAIPGETRQVLLNLVRNACEAITRPGARVSVRLAGSSSAVEIVLADQGDGIDPDLLPTLFDFGTSTKGEQGNGMGLWTVKHILNKHGGEIGVESVPGEGTRFRLMWPKIYVPSGDSLRGSGPANCAGRGDAQKALTRARNALCTES